MKHIWRSFGLCLIALILFFGIALLPGQAQAAAAPTLVKKNGVWYYVENDALNPKATTLCKYNGAWYYVENGKVNFSATTLCKYKGTWYYVEKGKVNFNATTLCKYKGTWYYVEKGKVNFNTTTLCQYNGKWYYVSGGKLQSSATTLCKYNGAWYYVENGKVNFNATTLCKYSGKWYYVSGGKLQSSATTLCKYSGAWYYVENGKVNFNATTLCKYNNKWYYVAGGKLSTKTALVNFRGSTYYVKGGTTQPNFWGQVSVGGSTYYLARGVVTACHISGHRYVSGVCTACQTEETWSYVNGGDDTILAVKNGVTQTIRLDISHMPQPDHDDVREVERTFFGYGDWIFYREVVSFKSRNDFSASYSVRVNYFKIRRNGTGQTMLDRIVNDEEWYYTQVTSLAGIINGELYYVLEKKDYDTENTVGCWLYRIKITDGTDDLGWGVMTVDLSDYEHCSALGIKDGWLYFSNQPYYGPLTYHKIGLDGNGAQQITPEQIPF